MHRPIAHELLHEGKCLHGSSLDDIDDADTQDALAQVSASHLCLDMRHCLRGDGSAHGVPDQDYRAISEALVHIS